MVLCGLVVLVPTLALLAGVAAGVAGAVFAFFAAGAASLSESESESLSESEDSALRFVPLKNKKRKGKNIPSIRFFRGEGRRDWHATTPGRWFTR